MGPRRLPKLELAQGIPATLRTLVAIPMLLTDEAGDRRGGPQAGGPLAGQLRSRAALCPPVGLGGRRRASRCPRIRRCSRARAPRSPRSTTRHGPAAGGGDRFWVLHRRRLWNAREGVWMGWERKRGKLRELNRLLRGATDTSFLPPDPGAAPAPSGIRYVITLDADTRLPREAARRLVGTIAHPLEPARLRRRRRAGRRRARDPPAAGDAHAARDGMGHALPARLLGPARHRSLRVRGVRRVPGPLRRGDLHRQGNLRRGCVRARARRPRAGEHAALPRSLRGPLRPRRVRLGRGALRGISRPLRSGGLAPAPLGPRRLAAAALDPGAGAPRAGGRPATRDSGDRALEDDRQPAAQPRRRRRRSRPARGRVVSARRRAPGGGRSSCSASSPCRRSSPSSRASCRSGAASPSGASCAGSRRTSRSASPRRRCG